jgi:hypothetical protein
MWTLAARYLPPPSAVDLAPGSSFRLPQLTVGYDPGFPWDVALGFPWLR